MKIAIWKTGHEIADSVAESLARGIPNVDAQIYNRWKESDYSGVCTRYDASIGYGILRGQADVFKSSRNWFNVDRGYFRPSHYDGYYRISHQGTQQTHDWLEPDCNRLAALKIPVAPWRGHAPDKPVLVCPPSEYVAEFFGERYWLLKTEANLAVNFVKPKWVVRKKGDPSVINFQDYNYVLTFNSSVGWQALQAGVPCVSDATHSMVGSWFAQQVPDFSLAKLSQAQYVDRTKLFAMMAAHQFTLSEIEQGEAWPLLRHYLHERPST